MVEQITVEELHARFKAQGVSAREHVAVVCPICATVQSMTSLIRAGGQPDKVENSLGFSCEGRITGAGPWPSSKDRSAKARKRREVRGCDWSLGGLFRIHKLEVMSDGKAHPFFELATPEQAQALEAQMAPAAA
jgi:hypothetical protein